MLSPSVGRVDMRLKHLCFRILGKCSSSQDVVRESLSPETGIGVAVLGMLRGNHVLMQRSQSRLVNPCRLVLAALLCEKTPVVLCNVNEARKDRRIIRSNYEEMCGA